jgi:hypothetical protein
LNGLSLHGQPVFYFSYPVVTVEIAEILLKIDKHSFFLNNFSLTVFANT